VGPSAIYSLNPCTEEFARAVIDAESGTLAVVSLANQKLISATLPGEEEGDDGDDNEYE
jgi:hypothetical protein